MNVSHFEKGLQLQDKDLLLLARKIGKLATYCARLKDADSSIRIEAERRPTKKESDQVKVMLTVELPKAVLRSESRRPWMLDAVDRCIVKITPQLKRYKEKRTGRAKAHRRTRHVA
jgi:ribosomal subunit interface protein